MILSQDDLGAGDHLAALEAVGDYDSLWRYLFKFAAFMLSSWSLNTISISIICMRREGGCCTFPKHMALVISHTHTQWHISPLYSPLKTLQLPAVCCPLLAL